MSDLSGGLGRLEAKIDLDTTPLSAGVAKARGQFTSLEGATAKSTGAINTKVGGLATTLKGFGTVFAAAGAVDVFSGMIAAAGEAEKVAAQTEAGIASTGGAAGVTAEHIGTLSEKIKRLSGFEDEAVQEGANMLLTFTNIRNAAGEGNNIFDQSTMALADMAARMGTDVPSAAVQLGKALNDPIAGIGSLGRVGVQFTDEQKGLIKSLVESGDVMGAQKVILGELNTQFGGSAKALGDARTPHEKFSQAMGDLQEKVGLALLPALEKLTPSIIKLADTFAKLMPIIEPIITIMASAPPTISLVMDAFGKLGPVLEAVGRFFADLATKAWALVTGVGDALAKVWEFVSGIPAKLGELLAGAASWLINTGVSIVAGLVGGLESAAGSIWGWLTGLPGRIWEALGDVGQWLLNTGAQLIGGLLSGIESAAGGIWDWITGFFSGLPGRIAELARGMWDGIGDAFKAAINFIIRGWNSIEFRIPPIDIGPISFGGKTIGLPDIPELHSGGIVPGRPGEEVLALLQAGERVLSLSQLDALGGRGTPGGTVNRSEANYNINVVGMGAAEQAKVIRRELQWLDATRR